MSKKKIAAIVAGALVVALALPTMAFAGPHGGFGGRIAQCQGEGLGVAVVRTQGILSEACARAFVDADGDGVCDNYADGAGCGRGYVDADNDGVCDNYGHGGACGRGGNGAQGLGMGQGNGCGMGQGGRHHQRA